MQGIRYPSPHPVVPEVISLPPDLDIVPLPSKFPEGIDVWCYRGMVLLSDDRSAVTLEQLTEFVTWVGKHMPEANIRVHQHGLRATATEGKEGPHLDWRDW